MKNLIRRIDKNTQRFTETFGDLTTKQLNWKPDTETWSIAQNIRHIIKMNETYCVEMDKLEQDKGNEPFIARFDFLLRFMGNSIARYGQPDRKKRTDTFDLWEPEDKHYPTTILSEFEHHQEEFKEQINKSERFIKKGAVIPSPATNLLYFKLDKALEFIISHEKRHFNQAREVLEKMDME